MTLGPGPGMLSPPRINWRRRTGLLHTRQPHNPGQSTFLTEGSFRRNSSAPKTGQSLLLTPSLHTPLYLAPHSPGLVNVRPGLSTVPFALPPEESPALSYWTHRGPLNLIFLCWWFDSESNTQQWSSGAPSPWGKFGCSLSLGIALSTWALPVSFLEESNNEAGRKSGPLLLCFMTFLGNLYLLFKLLSSPIWFSW